MLFFYLGLEITGNEDPLTLGNTATLTCTYDLTAIAVEWVYNGQVLVHTAESQAELVFNPVNDSLHNREYTCRAISQYGIQEASVTTTVTGEICVQL